MGVAPAVAPHWEDAAGRRDFLVVIVGIGLELHCCIVIVIRVPSDFRF